MQKQVVSHERLKVRLELLAAPTFAIMALLESTHGGGPAELLCAAAQHGSPLGGMVPMYLLMSAFHSAPWLKLISSRRNSAWKTRATCMVAQSKEK